MQLVKHKPPTARLPAGYEAFSGILTEASLLTDTHTDTGDGDDAGDGSP